MEVTMDEFEIVTVINRPPHEVFAYLVDIEKAPRWTTSLTQARKTSDGLT
jgi:uncharacterized protein YndB with AHSA1/START domain